MKALRVGVRLLIIFSGVLGFAGEPAADVDPWSGVTGLLAQEHQHSRPSTPPLSLTELEAAALANNPEIRVAMRRVAETARFPVAHPWDLVFVVCAASKPANEPGCLVLLH